MKIALPMVFPGYWLPWQKSRLVEQVAGEVARQCRASLWQRMCQKTITMSVSEIKGYVRARAAGFVGNEVDLACMRRRLSAKLRSQVLASAIEQLTTMVIRDVLSDPIPGDIRTMAA